MELRTDYCNSPLNYSYFLTFEGEKQMRKTRASMWCLLVVTGLVCLLPVVSAVIIDLSCVNFMDVHQNVIYRAQYSFALYSEPSFKLAVSNGTKGWIAVGFDNGTDVAVAYYSTHTTNVIVDELNATGKEAYFENRNVAIDTQSMYRRTRKGRTYLEVKPRFFQSVHPATVNRLFLFAKYTNSSISNATVLTAADFIGNKTIDLYGPGDDVLSCIVDGSQFYNIRRGMSIFIPRILSTAMGALLLFALFFLRNTPLISRRSVTPFLCCTCLIIGTLGACSGVIIHMDVSSEQLMFAEKYATDGYLDFRYRSGTIFIIIANAFSFVAIACYLLMIFRYFLIRHIYGLMATENLKLGWFNLRTCRILTSTPVYIIAVLIAGLSYSSISFTFMIMDLSGRYTVPMKSMNVKNYCYLAAIFLVAVVSLLAAFYDLIKKAGSIKQSGLRHFFIFDDPLFFRFEFMVFGLFLFLHIFYTFFFLTKKTHVSLLVLRGVTVWFEDMSLLFLAGGGTACTYEIVRWFKSRNGANRKEVTVEKDRVLQTLLDSESYELLRQYSIKEMSYENLLLWKELYQAKESDCFTMEQLYRISSRYLTRNSDYEVNVPSEAKKSFERMMPGHHTSDFRNSVSIDARNLLQYQPDEVVPFSGAYKLYNAVFVNICDTFTRFSDTREYKLLLESRQMLQDSFHI